MPGAIRAGRTVGICVVIREILAALLGILPIVLTILLLVFFVLLIALLHVLSSILTALLLILLVLLITLLRVLCATLTALLSSVGTLLTRIGFILRRLLALRLILGSRPPLSLIGSGLLSLVRALPLV